MKIFITGATGYVGHELCLQLAGKGFCVHALVRDPQSPRVPKHNNIRVFKGDITNRLTIRHAMKECLVVFHTAAMVKLWAKEPSEFYRVNVNGTRNVLEEAVQQGVRKLVFTSTCGILGRSVDVPVSETGSGYPVINNDYDQSKLAAENLVSEYYLKRGLFTVIVSLSKVYGPGIETHPVSVNKVIRNFVQGKITFIPKPAGLLANYCFISDVVKGHILAMEKGFAGEKYILGGENVTYAEFFQQLRTASGSRATVIPVPGFIVKRIAALQSLFCKINGKDPFVTPGGVDHLFCNKTFSSKKAIGELGYQPTSLQTGLRHTIQFINCKESR
ncbi:MAG: NAD-dependent epimerase/dehydratase family protein [Chitinophagaceae bacterium]